VELHQVRYFVALARSLNFTRAAEQCNITQPALTKAVQKLEEELGGPLVHRERLLTQLTDLGKLVLPMLERILAAADAVRMNAREFQRKTIAPLRIALTPSVSAVVILRPLHEMAHSLPGLHIEVLEAKSDEVFDHLLGGEFNVAVAAEGVGPQPERIDHWHLFDERIMVVVAATDRLAAMSTIPVNELKSATWLEPVGCDVTQQFWRRIIFPTDQQPQICHRGHRLEHLQYMVAAGLGVMLIPEHMPHPAGSIARPIAGDPIRQRVGLFVVAGRCHYSPALEAFVKIARRCDWRSELALLAASASNRTGKHKSRPSGLFDVSAIETDLAS
jgi:DNA-binding transcriptional LysR family regulator